MIQHAARLFLFFFAVMLFFSCKEKTVEKHETDSPEKGTINISVDESFEPVISEQIAMYEASFPGTKIIAHYKSEADCLKDYFNDTATRMAIITRGLTSNEEKYMTGKLNFGPGWNAVASDAIAIIVNNKSRDTLFTLDRLRQQLTGKLKNEDIMVFDGLNKTSTVRFVEDSILKGRKFDTSEVRAVKSSSEVLEYVASHEKAVGFVGINRIGNPEDTAQVHMLTKIKIAAVKCDVCVNTPYVFPSQESIQNHRYPLVRGLYYLTKENYKSLAAGFVSFLKYERGQLIFRRAYLGPVMDFMVRDVKINEEMPKK